MFHNLISDLVLFVFIIIIIENLLQINSDEECYVKIGNSVLKGLKAFTKYDSVMYCKYLDVPYAFKPKRFEESELKKISWNGEKNFINESRKCPQIKNGNQIIGKEDCLHLNIYVPMVSVVMNENENHNGNMSTLVWIHGGTFNYGSNKDELKDVDEFLKQGIITIKINYRLGVLGFFCPSHERDEFALNDKNEIISDQKCHNFGLKDQKIALKWINRYIQYFNGNTSDITLGGWSAGASAITYHLLYSESELIEHNVPLFNKVIIISGTIQNPWSSVDEYRLKNCSLELCRKLRMINCDLNNLQKFSLYDIMSILMKSSDDETFNFKYFGTIYPCFMPMIKIHNNELKNNKNTTQNILNGSNNNAKKECIEDFNHKNGSNEEYDYEKINTKYSIIARSTPLLIGLTSLEENCDANQPFKYEIKNFEYPFNYEYLIEAFKNFVEKLKEINQLEVILNLRQIADMSYDIINFADKYSSHNNSSLIFMYNFNMTRIYDETSSGLNSGNSSDSRKKLKTKWWCRKLKEKGSFHGDDIEFLFDGKYSQDHRRNEMLKLLANFIKYGNPNSINENSTNIIWPSYGLASRQILNINDQGFTIVLFNSSILYQLWKIIHDCFYFDKCKIIIYYINYFAEIISTMIQSNSSVMVDHSNQKTNQN